MPKNTWIKVSGTWKKIFTIWEKVSGVWQDDVMSWIKVGGIWKDCYTPHITLDAADYTTAMPADPYHLKFYYVISDAPPYNELQDLELGSLIKLHVDFDNYGTTANLVIARDDGGGVGDQIPDPFPDEVWALICAVFYTDSDGKYRLYYITEGIASGPLFDEYVVDPAIGYAYYLDYEKELTGWPVDMNDL